MCAPCQCSHEGFLVPRQDPATWPSSHASGQTSAVADRLAVLQRHLTSYKVCTCAESRRHLFVWSGTIVAAALAVPVGSDNISQSCQDLRHIKWP